ncbi:hypothetical protein IWQ60_008052 [Tieghemiomyces parasiticus]|uniref:RRM domain-containing protein n=1 Tax=Tieghemiomyces parasiticus TaxID=78921 RepID=A0A9W7ZU11_9FUNG|nr:hypothetical protein IWQ60_008052 [Tieghemiomyces parasiticus]
MAVEDSLNDGPAGPRGEPRACLFVGSLNIAKTDQELHEGTLALFERYGEVLDLKISRDKHGRPYAFVQFRRTDDANAALNLAQGALLHDRHVRIERAKVNRTLICQVRDAAVTEEALRRTLAGYGDVEDALYWTEARRGAAATCAMVKYRYRECASKAFSALRKERQWLVEWASNASNPPSLGSVSQQQALARHGPPPGRGSPARRAVGRPIVSLTDVFVGNLDPYLVTRAALLARYGAFGEVETLDYAGGPTDDHDHDDGTVDPGRPRRVAHAFVKFTDEMAAALAIARTDRQPWLGRSPRVTYKEIRPPTSAYAPVRRHSLMHWQPIYGSDAPEGMFPPPGHLYPAEEVYYAYGAPGYPALCMPEPHHYGEAEAAYPTAADLPHYPPAYAPGAYWAPVYAAPFVVPPTAPSDADSADRQGSPEIIMAPNGDAADHVGNLLGQMELAGGDTGEAPAYWTLPRPGPAAYYLSLAGPPGTARPHLYVPRNGRGDPSRTRRHSTHPTRHASSEEPASTTS